MIMLGRQDEEAASVLVNVAQPVGQAVWQGRKEVRTGVLGQRVLGPGIVVVLCVCVLCEHLLK